VAEMTLERLVTAVGNHVHLKVLLSLETLHALMTHVVHWTTTATKSHNIKSLSTSTFCKFVI